MILEGEHCALQVGYTGENGKLDAVEECGPRHVRRLPARKHKA